MDGMIVAREYPVQNTDCKNRNAQNHLQYKNVIITGKDMAEDVAYSSRCRNILISNIAEVHAGSGITISKNPI